MLSHGGYHYQVEQMRFFRVKNFSKERWVYSHLKKVDSMLQTNMINQQGISFTTLVLLTF